jgi:hypothetical protein
MDFSPDCEQGLAHLERLTSKSDAETGMQKAGIMAAEVLHPGTAG